MNIKKSIFILLTPLVVLLILLAMFIGLLPMTLKWVASDWLEQQGIKATIETVDINLAEGRINLANMQGHNDAGRTFMIREFLLDIELLPLLDHIVKIEKIKLNGLQLDVVQKAEGFSVAGIEINTRQQTAVEPAQKSDTSSSWHLELMQLSLNDIKSCYQISKPQRRLCTKVGSFNWQGRAAFEASENANKQLSVDGSIDIKSLIVSDQIQKQTILGIGSIQLVKLLINSVDDIKLDKFIVSGFSMFPLNDKERQLSSLLEFDNLKINNFNYLNQKIINIKTIAMNGFGASVLRNPQGEFELVRRIEEINFLPPADKKPKKESSPPPVFIIDEITLQEGKPVRFFDSSIASPVDVFVTVKSFALSSINTGDTRKLSHMSLNVISEKYGNIEFNGDIQLMAEAASFDIKGKITGLDLKPVGSYLEATQGYSVKSGQLNADVSLFASNGKLDSMLLIDLKQFRLKALTADEKKKLEKDMGLGMPLETALNLLRDSDNSIKLKLPITGDMNNIELDPSDAIYKSLSTAISTAVINYYTPFGLVTAAKGLFDLATALRFQPIIFQIAKTSLSDDQYPDLDKLVVLMNQRPGLHVTLCGFANYDDLYPDVNIDQLNEMKSEKYKPDEVIVKKLLAIAADRAEAVKHYMVDKGIAADRLVLCKPEFAVKAVAGVEISI